MSLNTAHINGGVLIHSGECILLYADKVFIEWNDVNNNPAFKGTKKGRVYLTTHRMIFNSSVSDDKMKSFSFPFVTLSNVEVLQPVFSANCIRGNVVAQENGNWVGQQSFKITFKQGGAIEFGQAMLKAASLARRSDRLDPNPPPYDPSTGNSYPAPPPAYAPPAAGYYGWVPPTNVFRQQPPQNSVYMCEAPPPYPGITNPGGPQQRGGAAADADESQQNVAPTPGAFAKAAEAAQSAYYDPNQPQMAYVPPPAYYENPPTYDQAIKKSQ